ncbi:hypothetical protein [Agrobacterium vitis]|uniref:hypothetical protein n=1 Tax=Agrobacterium vitis TaxID=373 RepID=UPI00203433E4|nr:hypothetical protein [Agrobacterium vitis]
MSSESIFRQAVLNGTFTYTARPDPMPGDLRMSWGLAILVLALFYSRAKKSNFQKLQFLAHSVRIDEGREEVRGLLAGKYKPADVSVRVEPSLNRAVAFAHALKLVKIEKGTSITLSDDGVKLAETILKEGEILKEERQFLSEVAPRMTDALMKRVWRLEDLL